jgi:hypothetical protein
MSEPTHPKGSRERRVADTEPAQRKPYEKPAFIREQVFETMALACGKINPTTGQCRAVKKNS